MRPQNFFLFSLMKLKYSSRTQKRSGKKKKKKVIRPKFEIKYGIWLANGETNKHTKIAKYTFQTHLTSIHDPGDSIVFGNWIQKCFYITLLFNWLQNRKVLRNFCMILWVYQIFRTILDILTGILLLFFLLLPFWTISFLIVCSDIWSVVFNVYDFQCFYVFVLNVIVVVDFDCLLCKMKELINGVEIEQTSFDGECRSWVGHLSFVHWTSNSNSVALVYFAIFQKWCMHIWRNQAENFW